MNDLVSFLRTQLDDDERVAREAPGPAWVLGIERDGKPGRWLGAKAHLVMTPPSDPIDPLAVGDELLRADSQHLGRTATAHAARWDPARVLAEIDAKRRILDQLELWLRGHDVERAHEYPGTTGGVGALLTAVRTLALPYADQPGYREEWRP